MDNNNCEYSELTINNNSNKDNKDNKSQSESWFSSVDNLWCVIIFRLITYVMFVFNMLTFNKFFGLVSRININGDKNYSFVSHCHCTNYVMINGTVNDIYNN